MAQSVPNPSFKGVVGIQNMGNTCYANSTIQLLRASSEWDIYCLTEPFTEQLKYVPDTNPHKRVLLAYQEILKSLWSAYRPAYVRPLGFISEVAKAVQHTVYESFGMPVPNDSHEYLVYLLDHFHEALKTTRVEVDLPLCADPVESMRIRAQNGWNQYHARNQSKVVDLFFGMTRKTTQCTACEQKSYRWEVFNSLKVPCEGATWEDWIEKELCEVSEVEGYACDACHGRHRATLQTHLWRLPSNLFLTLRRFHYDGRKNMTPCPYHGTPFSFQKWFAPEVPEAETHGIYELRGISDHHGSHLGGHYTAQFKHPISQQWWWMDDEKAHPMETPQCSASNYIFFFKKMSTEQSI